MIPLSDGSKTEEELHDDRSDANAKSVIRLDIGRITDEVPSQAEINKMYYHRSHPTTKQSPHDLDKQALHEITLKICGIDGEMYKREVHVWSQVKQVSYSLPC